MKLSKPSENAIRRPSSITPSDLLDETAEGLALLKVASEAFLAGDCIESERVEAVKDEYLNPAKNQMYRTFENIRQYAFEGCPAAVFEGDLYHTFPFIYGVEGIAEHVGYTAPGTCSYVLQAAYAREKLYWDDAEIDLMFHHDDAWVEYHDDFPTGVVGRLSVKPGDTRRYLERDGSYKTQVFKEAGEHTYVSGGLMVLDLALLTGMDEQSVRNALNKAPEIRKIPIPGSKMFEISPSDAREWLRGRGEFVPSVPSGKPGQIKVPKAKDGSVFDSSCKAPRSGYRIGPKGEERHFDDYREALSALLAMPKQHWRRPNSEGRMGIVRGVDYAWRSPDELGISER